MNPDSSAPTLAHAAEIRGRKAFVEVGCAFWKEEPSLRDAIFLFDPEAVREVYVVPNFISEGYFTQTVVRRRLATKKKLSAGSSALTRSTREYYSGSRFSLNFVPSIRTRVSPIFYGESVLCRIQF